MVPISVEKFADMVMKNNKGYNRKELIEALESALEAKKHGAKCMICGQPIWAGGSAITGTNMCFTCTTGEGDDSKDYEILINTIGNARPPGNGNREGFFVGVW